jgi:hypothetical protein
MNTNTKYTVSGIIALIVLLIIIGIVAFRSPDADDAFDYQNQTATTSNPSVTQSESQNIRISLPQPGQRVGTPIVISGEARVFENTVNYRLKDENGEVVAEGYTTAQSATVGEYGDFRGELTYMSESDGKGTIEIFSISADTGAEIDMVVIPVQFTETPEFIKG